MSRILIIDDEELVRMTIGQTLEQAGHTAIEACNGREGVAMFRDQAPDLVITDLIMPEQEGIETISELRRIDPRSKIIAISGGGRVGATDFLQVAESLGANRILPKPFSPEELISAAEDVLASAG